MPAQRSHGDIIPHLLLTPPMASLVLSSCAAAWLGFFLLFFGGGSPPSPLSARARVHKLRRILARRTGGPRCSFSTLLITAANGNGAVSAFRGGWGWELPQPPGPCWGADAFLIPIVPWKGADWEGGTARWALMGTRPRQSRNSLFASPPACGRAGPAMPLWLVTWLLVGNRWVRAWKWEPAGCLPPISISGRARTVSPKS